MPTAEYTATLVGRESIELRPGDDYGYVMGTQEVTVAVPPGLQEVKAEWDFELDESFGTWNEARFDRETFSLFVAWGFADGSEQGDVLAEGDYTDLPHIVVTLIEIPEGAVTVRLRGSLLIPVSYTGGGGET